MTIRKLYSLECTDCGTSVFESPSGSWAFESEQEAIDVAKGKGWSIAEEVPNGSKWDFCPRCLSKRGQ